MALGEQNNIHPYPFELHSFSLFALLLPLKRKSCEYRSPESSRSTTGLNFIHSGILMAETYLGFKLRMLSLWPCS